MARRSDVMMAVALVLVVRASADHACSRIMRPRRVARPADVWLRRWRQASRKTGACGDRRDLREEVHVIGAPMTPCPSHLRSPQSRWRGAMR
jgi:hypothetical protein